MTRVDHIGIIVSDLDAAVAKLGVLFGEARRKDLPDVGLRVAEFRAENVTIELLEYTSNADFARRVMGERIGLNHLSLAVEDAERSIGALRDAGFTPMQGFPRQGVHGRVAFFEPDNASGLLFEICQPDG
ncbi:MAG TPA: VOC family protein [Burkholderiales bacterium]|nr:VOC family protein [Burkholderiales bacterium]